MRTRFSTGTSPINGSSSTPQILESRSSVPLDIVTPEQDTSAPIGAGSESMHENVGTANEASSSPEWVVSNKEMRYDIKVSPVPNCCYADNNIEKHVYVSHLPACLNPILTFTPGQLHLPEERWQAICYLASLLDVSHPGDWQRWHSRPSLTITCGWVEGCPQGWLRWPSIEGWRTTRGVGSGSVGDHRPSFSIGWS